MKIKLKSHKFIRAIKQWFMLIDKYTADSAGARYRVYMNFTIHRKECRILDTKLLEWVSPYIRADLCYNYDATDTEGLFWRVFINGRVGIYDRIQQKLVVPVEYDSIISADDSKSMVICTRNNDDIDLYDYKDGELILAGLPSSFIEINEYSRVVCVNVHDDDDTFTCIYYDLDNTSHYATYHGIDGNFRTQIYFVGDRRVLYIVETDDEMSVYNLMSKRLLYKGIYSEYGEFILPRINSLVILSKESVKFINIITGESGLTINREQLDSLQSFRSLMQNAYYQYDCNDEREKSLAVVYDRIIHDYTQVEQKINVK